MKERGLIFGAPMVRALLADRKTQTRRILKLPPAVVKRGIHPRMDEWMPNRYTKGSGQYPGGNLEYTGDQPPGLLVTCLDGTCQRVACPYGFPSEKLWVRETWAHADGRHSMVPVVYRADGDSQPCTDGRWRPPIFMPRNLSRITLEATDVRVQRLQDISEEDARAEGVTSDNAPGLAPIRATSVYAELWDSINGKGSWQANPFVWSISFKRVGQ